MWALDYQYDQTADGRMLRLLNIVDEFTREALVMRVERSITAEQTVSILDDLVAGRDCQLTGGNRGCAQNLYAPSDERIKSDCTSSRCPLLTARDADPLSRRVSRPATRVAKPSAALTVASVDGRTVSAATSPERTFSTNSLMVI